MFIILLAGPGTPSNADPGSSGTFYLEQTRTGAVFGPFENRDGANIELGESTWLLRRLAGVQVAFEQPARQLQEGPYVLAPGRIVELDGHFFVVRVRAEPPADVAVPSVSLPPPVGPERRPAVPSAWPASIGEIGVMPRSEERIGLRFEPWSRISMGWNLGGGGAREGGDLTERSMGLRLRFQGWETALNRIYDSRVRDTPVETGFEIAALRIGNGDGWSGELGYGLDLYREAYWRFGLSAQIGYVHRNLDLSTTRLKTLSSVVTNETVSVAYAYATETSSFALREMFALAVPELTVEYGTMGCEVSLRMLVYSHMSTDAHLDTSDGRVALEAKRRHPVTGRLKAWRWFGPLRLCAGLDLGGTQAVAAEIEYRW